MHERININGYTYDQLAFDVAHEGPDVVHDVVAFREDGADVCTCGLVLSEGADLRQALGHVDPMTKQPATTFVLHLPEQAYYQIICKGCAWQQIRPTLELATACRRRHECPSVSLPLRATPLRTLADLLAAALERTGWTVAADDPRAEQFLTRTIELTREQSAGRINIDQLTETLRREFPLT